jgi:hypothetical protein
MNLRGRFGITGSHREVTRKVPGNNGKVPNFIENISVKELCQGND